ADTGVNRIYFADLVGAGIGCLLAIPLIVWLGPPLLMSVAAVVFAIVAMASGPRRWISVGAGLTAAALLVPLIAQTVLPDIRTDDHKEHAPVTEASGWGPVFRVEVVHLPGTDGSSMLLLH